MRRLANALRYSARGFKAAFEHEAAFRQELFLLVALLIGALFFVLIVELINSAIEALADAVTLDHHTLIGRAKDLGSAAVMLSIILAVTVWSAVGISHFL